MLLTNTLERLLEEFLEHRQTSVDNSSQIKDSCNSPDEMEQAFEEWVNELVHQFVSEKDWEQIAAEHWEGES